MTRKRRAASLTSLSDVLLRHRRRGAGRTVAMRGGRERLGGVALGLLRREARAPVFSRPEMRFGAPDGGVCRIQIRRARGRESGGGSRRDRLASIAQFLHGGS